MAAIASFGAAVIHVAVVPAHWQEWFPGGLFFVALALFQLIWACLVLTRATVLLLAAGILVNLGAVAVWAVSRTAGTPFGPHAGQAEVVQAADLCALMLEIYVVMGAGWVWYRGRQRESIPAFAATAILYGAGAVIALAATVGVASGLQHGHHGPPGGHAEAHHRPSDTHAEGHHGHPGGDRADRHGHPEPATSPAVVEVIGTPAVPAPVESALPSAEPPEDSADGGHHHE